MAGESDRALILPVFDPPPRVLIVTSPYYGDVATALETGARAVLERAEAHIDILAVPGALEIPGAIRTALRHFDGFVALGCVIRGETAHFDIVAGESARGLMALTLQGHAVGNGILTVENLAQALVRARDQDKGGGAAEAALHLIAAARRFRTHPTPNVPSPERAAPDILIADAPQAGSGGNLGGKPSDKADGKPSRGDVA
ncbi:MAG: 6,7-dimethyl-8-ribityllumazine synthase [Pseudomonadota bacterium]